MVKKIISKSLSRYLAVQATYSQSFGFDVEEIKKNFTNNQDFRLHIDFEREIEKEKFDKNFFLNIFDNVSVKEDFILSLIKKNLEKNWSIERLPKVSLAILRVAISEMITYPKTSIGIIVSEYLSLAESFDLENDSGFINAILDKIHKELEESNG
jgi:N utilization substance protein B